MRGIEVTAFKPSKLPVPPIRHGTWWPPCENDSERENRVPGRWQMGVGWDLIGVWWRRSSSSQNPRPSPCRPLWLARFVPTDLDTDRVAGYVPTRWSIDLPGCSLGEAEGCPLICLIHKHRTAHLPSSVGLQLGFGG